jgi:hypothetical protein
MQELKQFDEWNELKKKIDNKNIKIKFSVRNIYLMSVGQNVGYETFGKGDEFLRPVLVYKKLSKEIFIGIPLTSKQKEGSYYFSFNFKGKTSVAMFNQIRVFDIRREKVFYGRISQNTFDNLKKKFLAFIKDS